MPKVVLRFYGRYAFAKERAGSELTGRIHVVAPRFPSPFDPHESIMTIRRDKLALTPEFTDLPPTRKAVTDAPTVVEADQFLWNLSGMKVTLAAEDDEPSATLEKDESVQDRTFFEMTDLLRRGESAGRVLDISSLTPSVNGKTQTVVELTRGKGFVRLASLLDVAFLVSRADALDGNPANDALQGVPDAQGTLNPFPICDLVEFEYDVAVRTAFTLLLTDLEGSGAVKRVSVQAESQDETIVIGFSNFCPDLPTFELYDLEFARYYDLLTEPPVDDEMMIPRHFTADGGEIEECGIQVHVTYDAASKTVGD